MSATNKIYVVKIGYLETNYVEREVLVKANNAREASKLARSGDTEDERQEDVCEPQERWKVRVIDTPYAESA